MQFCLLLNSDGQKKCKIPNSSGKQKFLIGRIFRVPIKVNEINVRQNLWLSYCGGFTVEKCNQKKTHWKNEWMQVVEGYRFMIVTSYFYHSCKASTSNSWEHISWVHIQTFYLDWRCRQMKQVKHLWSVFFKYVIFEFYFTPYLLFKRPQNISKIVKIIDSPNDVRPINFTIYDSSYVLFDTKYAPKSDQEKFFAKNIFSWIN